VSGSSRPQTGADPGPPDPAPGPSSREQGITVKVEAAAGVVTVFIDGELDLVTTPVLAGQLELILRDKPTRIVFDLATTAFADIGSVRLLVRAGGLGTAGRRPVIRHPRPGVRRILELTGLDADCEIEG
jgi:anti-anti-sigma factor